MMNTAIKKTFNIEQLPSPRTIASASDDSCSDTKPNRAGTRQNRRRIAQLLDEMHRRRVCRSATMYSVGFWLTCQVVELVAPALGLPEWTLKFVIVLGLILFLVTLTLSWLLDITPNGLVADPGSVAAAGAGNRAPTSAPRHQRIVDCALLCAALAIGVQLAAEPLIGNSFANSPAPRRLAIESFEIVSATGTRRIANGLDTELQHALLNNVAVVVVDPRAEFLTHDTLRLKGTIGIDDKVVRVNALLVDNASGEVTWSKVFEQPRTGTLVEMAQLSRQIVAALPESVVGPAQQGDRHAK
jgi:TolB-like protein